MRFNEFAKAASDFFSKELPADALRLQASTKAPAGLRAMLPQKAGATTFTDDFKVTVTRPLGGPSQALGLELRSGTALTLVREKLAAKVVVTMGAPGSAAGAQIIFAPVGAADGPRLDLSTRLAAGKPSGLKAGAEYVRGPLALTASTDLASSAAGEEKEAKRLQPQTMAASAALRYGDVQFGGSVEYDAPTKAMGAYAVGVSLDRPREKASLLAHNGASSFSAGYVQRFADYLDLAARATWAPTGDKDAVASKTRFEVGAKWWLSPPAGPLGSCCATSGSFLKATVDGAGRLALALASELRPGAQLVLGAVLDTASLTAPGASHKLGVDLLYTA